MTKPETTRFPNPPAATELLSAAHPSEELRQFLSHRRSGSKRMLVEPGPNSEEIDALLSIAARVPDHRKLGPWRFIVFTGDARDTFGKEIERVFKLKSPHATQEQIAEERARLTRAPAVIAVVSSPVDDGRTPIWEQELSAGAVCYNLLLAASASGWGGVWLTEWLAFDDDISAAMGLSESERFAGFIYLGTPSAPSPERPRPNIGERTLRWKA